MIKRYLFAPDKYGEPQPFADRDGAWVRYEYHAAEVERLRAENERLRGEAEKARRLGEETLDDARAMFVRENERLRSRLKRFSADRDERRADGIYAAAYVAAPVSLTPQQAHAYAEDIVSIWRERAAQKGGSDG